MLRADWGRTQCLKAAEVVLLALDQGCRYADRVSACKLHSTKRGFRGRQSKKGSKGHRSWHLLLRRDRLLPQSRFVCCSSITYDLALSADATDECLPSHTLHCGCGALWIHQHAETALQPAGEQQHIMCR